MGGEKRNRETNSIYEGDDLEEAEYEVRKFLELLGKEIQIRVNIKDAAIDGIETINKILKDINNVVLNNNVIFYFVDGKAESIFGEYLLYLESKVGDGTCKVVVKSLKLFLNVVLDISNLEYGGEFESLKPMVLGMLLNKNIIENLMDVIHKLELQYNNEYSPANRELIFYEDVLFDYFNFLESVLELDPQKSSSGLLKYRKLLSWLLNSLDDSNGGSASGNGVKANATIGNASQNKIEILSIMFQNVTYSDLLELDTFSVNIMDLLLVKLANMGLIEGEVVGSENREFIYNIVDIMCSLLLFEKERLNFVELEGLELMLKFIKEKVFLRSLSVKVLSFALICDSNVNNKFVNL
ncbi:hypothetical protein FG386_001168 [Cryptosporidium ryanae]|uniref:uncharacterized protein n=1 Tax=Cryptosporidium ryanae TaxID=515981 RepID=UPI00351A6364|nr:hypothetical protein FG386_001168 [Cryptosporidium ryanae]